jgi:hypothetical protein
VPGLLLLLLLRLDMLLSGQSQVLRLQVLMLLLKLTQQQLLLYLVHL